ICFKSKEGLVEKRYTQTHEWIALNENGSEGTVGITDFAQKEVTDVFLSSFRKSARESPREVRRLLLNP
ncbi:glycine cleavage system H protein, partial [mine drainage metagenome]